MAKGKQTCKILKEIRKQIAEENDIKLVVEECTYQGDCKGTCPKCEAEVRYLERELEKRQRMGKAAVFAGLSLGTIVAATGCGPFQPTAGMPMDPNDTTRMEQVDTIEEPLAGDVVAELPDTIVEDNDIVYDTMALEGIVMDDDEEETDVYVVVEQMPEFPGGNEKLREYILSNTQYPQEAIEKGIEGKVFVYFVVEPDGSVSNVEVRRSLCQSCDEEAVRVVKSLPKFMPGMQNGEVVRVSYVVPIFFTMEDKQD